ncbi:MAG TPA: 5-formyltetrahydrofolate cyclo-ligase [Pseudolabrys sp.]
MPGTSPGMTVEMPDAIEIQNQKKELRGAVLALRDALSPTARQAAAEAIAARTFPVAIAPGMIVSGFSPMKTEVNPIPLMRKLSEAGARLALPCIVGRGHALIMRAWDFGAPLAAGQWGIREPMPDAPEVAPDIMIVPLAAFDRAGQRIGYGAGYYDMTIAALRAKKKVVAVGVAFAAQEISKVPATERDERLDLMLTERETIDFRV